MHHHLGRIFERICARKVRPAAAVTDLPVRPGGLELGGEEDPPRVPHLPRVQRVVVVRHGVEGRGHGSTVEGDSVVGVDGLGDGFLVPSVLIGPPFALHDA